MFEVLSAASDVISVEQTRAGSLLTLKKSAPGEKQRGWPAGKLGGVALTLGHAHALSKIWSLEKDPHKSAAVDTSV